MNTISNTKQSAASEPIIRLLSHLCSDNADTTLTVLNWLAYPLQNPGVKMSSSIIVQGDTQAAGKSLFFRTVMQGIYGTRAVVIAPNALAEFYNDWAEEKTYCLYEESTSKKSKQNLINNLITSDLPDAHYRKFKNGYTQSKNINCVFISSNNQPLPIKANDNRFIVITPQKILGSTLKNAVLDSIKNGGTQAFHQYLLQLSLKAESTLKDADEAKFYAQAITAERWVP